MRTLTLTEAQARRAWEALDNERDFAFDVLRDALRNSLAADDHDDPQALADDLAVISGAMAALSGTPDDCLTADEWLELARER